MRLFLLAFSVYLSALLASGKRLHHQGLGLARSRTRPIGVLCLIALAGPSCSPAWSMVVWPISNIKENMRDALGRDGPPPSNTS